jgi:hypothetical protein
MLKKIAVLLLLIFIVTLNCKAQPEDKDINFTITIYNDKGNGEVKSGRSRIPESNMDWPIYLTMQATLKIGYMEKIAIFYAGDEVLPNKSFRDIGLHKGSILFVSIRSKYISQEQETKKNEEMPYRIKIKINPNVVDWNFLRMTSIGKKGRNASFAKMYEQLEILKNKEDPPPILTVWGEKGEKPNDKVLDKIW